VLVLDQRYGSPKNCISNSVGEIVDSPLGMKEGKIIENRSQKKIAGRSWCLIMAKVGIAIAIPDKKKSGKK